MGDQLVRSFPHSTRIVEIYGCRYRLFHKIDQNTITLNNIQKLFFGSLSYSGHENLFSNYYWLKANIFAIKFSLLATLISNNGKQFNNHSFMEFYAKLGIKQRFTLVEHLQSNGQVKLANRVILEGLKKRLDEAKG